MGFDGDGAMMDRRYVCEYCGPIGDAMAHRCGDKILKDRIEKLEAEILRIQNQNSQVDFSHGLASGYWKYQPFICPNCKGEGTRGGERRIWGACQENCWACQGTGIVWGNEGARA